MYFNDYCKDKAPVLVINASAMLVLSAFLILLKNTKETVMLIDIAWVGVVLVYFTVIYIYRKRYFNELTALLDELDERYLIAEVMKPSPRLEDKLYREILRQSNKSVIEKVYGLEKSQKEYKEYIESWIHEVKTPITGIHLICLNHKEEYTKQILLELDEIENQVENALYFARMEHTFQDYLIHSVNLRKVVLESIQTYKRYFIQCRMQIDLSMGDMIVSTDEKWVKFLLKQIFSNSLKYRKDEDPLIKIYIECGNKQKSLLIEDNGCGIVNEDLERIFSKGFTGKNGRGENNRSTGMGLYLCSRLCIKLGIGISCESKVGKYTRMILTFPDSEHNKILQK